MNPEDYVSYPLALALKKAGFDYPCYFYYTRKDSPDDHVYSTTSEEAPIDYNRSVYAGCSMPLLSQAQKWLREKKKLHILVDFDLDGDWYYKVFPIVGCCVAEGNSGYRTYEQALSDGISAALHLLDNEKE